jgi:hypothetical protein
VYYRYVALRGVDRRMSMAEPKISKAPNAVWAVAEFRDDEFRWALDAAGFLETIGDRANDAKVVSLPDEKMGLVFFRL